MNQVAIEKLYTWMRSEGFDRFFVYRPENLAGESMSRSGVRSWSRSFGSS